MFNHGLRLFSECRIRIFGFRNFQQFGSVALYNIALAPVDYNVIPQTVFYDGYITSHQRSTFLPSFKQLR